MALNIHWTIVDYERAEDTLYNDEIVDKYPNFLTHLERSYFDRKEKWDMCVRHENQLPTNNCNTNN